MRWRYSDWQSQQQESSSSTRTHYKGIRCIGSSLAERIVRAGRSAKPDEHLQTLTGQAQSFLHSNDPAYATITRAIAIVTAQGANIEMHRNSKEGKPHYSSKRVIPPSSRYQFSDYYFRI